MIFTSILGAIFTCTVDFNNPLDMNSTSYQKPEFIIKSVFPGVLDSIAADTIVFLIKKNRPELSLRFRTDSLPYSKWFRDTLLSVKSGKPGYHVIIFQGRYGEGGEVIDTAIHYEKITAPYIAAGPYQYKTDSAWIYLHFANGCTLHIDASGTPVLSYKWYKNSNLLFETDENLLFIPAFSRKDTGAYQCIVTNRWGSDTSRLLTLYYLPASPVAVNDTFFINEDSTLVIDPAFGVLSNDSDVGSDELVVKLQENVKNGLLSFAENGGFTYIPYRDFHGIDSFLYVARDSDNLSSNTSLVTMYVSNVNDNPVVKNHVERNILTEGESFCFSENSVYVSDVDNESDEIFFQSKPLLLMVKYVIIRPQFYQARLSRRKISVMARYDIIIMVMKAIQTSLS